MLAYIPVRFDVFRPIRRHLHWTLQNLIGFADRAGKCFPSIGKLCAATGSPRSTISRHLAQLVEAGVITRVRRPGGVYSYTIDSRLLPGGKALSHGQGRAIPPAAREENPGRKEGDSPNWEARLRGWRRRRFWLAWWGPKPSEPGCWVPAGLLADSAA